MYNRALQGKLIELSQQWSVISVTGPRQSGKTTLCKITFPEYEYVNLEDVMLRSVIAQDIYSYLQKHKKGLIIDEAQYLPDLFAAIQVVVDEDKSARFVLSGSSDFLLLKNISESLAGRVAVVRLLPLSLSELGDDANIDVNEIMFNGFYPAVWGDKKEPCIVYDSYVSTYLERDVRQLIAVKNIALFQRFIVLVASRIGNEFNANAISSELGVDSKTVSSWMSILETSYTAFRLQPYFKNVGKRLTKSSKIYFYDVGLVCFLLGIETPQQLDSFHLRGAIFENMVVVEMLKNRYNAVKRNNMLFYRDKTHEVDIITEDATGIKAFEIKSAVRYNSEFSSQLNYLKTVFGEVLVETTVIYGGAESFVSGANKVCSFRSL